MNNDVIVMIHNDEESSMTTVLNHKKWCALLQHCSIMKNDEHYENIAQSWKNDEHYDNIAHKIM